MKIIFDYNRTIFDPDTGGLYAGVPELLWRLSRDHSLYLISRDERTRRVRFESLGIKQYFQKIVFVEEKSKEVFQQIVDGKEKALVVGDSIRDEISIGNQLGCSTVRLRKGKFSTEVPERRDEYASFEITDIRELETIIIRHEE